MRISQSRKCTSCEMVFPLPFFLIEGSYRDICFLCDSADRRAGLEPKFRAFEDIADQIQEVDIRDPHVMKALDIASREGRLDPWLSKVTGLNTGNYRCPICGMLQWTLDEADKCCLPGVEEFERSATDEMLMRRERGPKRYNWAVE